MVFGAVVFKLLVWRAEGFFALKNPTASAGFEPANLGTKGQHVTPRPARPLKMEYNLWEYYYFKILSKSEDHNAIPRRGMELFNTKLYFKYNIIQFEILRAEIEQI